MKKFPCLLTGEFLSDVNDGADRQTSVGKVCILWYRARSCYSFVSLRSFSHSFTIERSAK